MSRSKLYESAPYVNALAAKDCTPLPDGVPSRSNEALYQERATLYLISLGNDGSFNILFCGVVTAL